MDSRSAKAWLKRALLAAAVVLPPSGAEAKRAEPFKGPVEAIVVEVLDGDTFVAEAQVWPGHSVNVNIRIRGIDAPEMKSRCEAEREAALKARQALAAMLADGAVTLTNIGGAKYYGRVLADVSTSAGEGVGSLLLGEGLVRRYFGGKRQGWCS